MIPKRRPGQCRHLRSKRMYSGSDDPRDFATSAYWCLRSMAAVGPDGDRVGESYCAQGRSCFEEARK